MKINRLDAHDRYQHFTKQSFDIAECCQDLINKRPYGDHPFYIFAHTRTEEDGATKRLIWQPRLTKPHAQSNSMLFKAYPGTDIIKVIWMIPTPELWDQYIKGKMTENKTVSESIERFKTNKNKLEEKEDDDMTDEQINDIYREISLNAQKSKRSIRT
jgi:hypothetical protein